MQIDHRAVRRSLGGSRTTRRAGTKTNVIPGSNGKRLPKYRHPRKSLKRTARRMRLAVRELIKKGGGK